MASSSTTVGRPKRAQYGITLVIIKLQERVLVRLLQTNVVCGKTIARKFSTNLKFHLKAMHIEMYGDVLKKEKDVKEKELKEKEKRSANGACNFSN